ncbi:La-related protein 1A [Echria macrotheca]|uniref:La-related protein 1A n=1 Tax=Echria macrotheca TaxID=438768 RepID=A0AAJ0BG20_9PEZI|nr:La-related protein 1A [Echria macrotheca]
MSGTTFSYAQAAKGHTITQSSPQLTSSPAPSSIKDDTTTATTSVSAPSVASNDADIRDLEKPTKFEAEVAFSRQDSDVAPTTGPVSSNSAVSEGLSKPSRDNNATVADSQPQNEEKGSRSASRTSRVNDAAEGRKGRKARKGRAGDKDTQSEQTQEDEKEKEAPKPIILSEAPPPAVNPWTVRREQQAAKTKVAVTPVTTSHPSLGQEPKKRQSSENGETHTGGVAAEKAKKTSDLPQGADQVPRRSAPRGSRAVEAEEKGSAPIPPVADVSSWPDPKAAAATEETSKKAQEKPEKPDSTDKENVDEAGTSKKKWVNLDITPSVVFNTPIPPRGAKPRGGARGGRDAGSSRVNHTGAVTQAGGSAGDRSAATNSVVGPKSSATRPREGSVQARATSQLQPAVPNTTGAAKSQPKGTNQGNAEQPRESGADALNVSSKRASSVRDIRTEFGHANFDTTPRVGPQERANGHHKGTEFSKDSHAGSHQQYQPREGRSDRGRGGFRGRVGHNGGVGSHMASASYGSNGQYGTHGTFPSRQNGVAPSPPPFGGQFPTHFSQQSRRGSKWGTNGQPSGRNGASGAVLPVKPNQAGEYPLAPYPPYGFPDAYTIIRQQVEYYFSVDNLCKDMHLRKQMDSQGFVPLQTIAGFKRMREVAKDPSSIRAALTYSELLDYVRGEDNVERLRIRDKWQNFVLPLSDRFESAQNDGPSGYTLLNHPMYSMGLYGPSYMHTGFAPPPTGVYPYIPDEQMHPSGYTNGFPYEHAMNGTGGLNGYRHRPETQLSAGVPEYSPPDSPLTLESLTNFSDEQVENLMVVVDFEKKDIPSASGINGNAIQSEDDAAHGSVNGVSEGGDGASHLLTSRSVSETSVSEPAGPSSNTRGRPYNEIKQEALEARSNAQPGETPWPMRELYRFWSKMLVNDFNSNVYTEFRTLALEDASRDVPAKCGMEYLLQFYNRLLRHNEGPKPWPQGRAIPGVLQEHYINAEQVGGSIGVRTEAAISTAEPTAASVVW